MSVQIQEVEIQPSPQGAQQPQQQGQGQASSQAPSPELGQEIARTVALLHTRDLRLHAD